MRTNVRRVQQRGHKLKRCRRFKHWKKKVEDEAKAIAEAREMQRKHPQWIYRAFPCPHCGYYHVGRDMEQQIRDLKREVSRLSDLLEDKDDQLKEAREENLSLRKLLGEYEQHRELHSHYDRQRLKDSCKQCGSTRRTCFCEVDR